MRIQKTSTTWEGYHRNENAWHVLDENAAVVHYARTKRECKEWIEIQAHRS